MEILKIGSLMLIERNKDDCVELFLYKELFHEIVIIIKLIIKKLPIEKVFN